MSPPGTRSPTLGSLMMGCRGDAQEPAAWEEAGELGCCFCKHGGPAPNGNTCGCGLLEWPQIPRWVSVPSPQLCPPAPGSQSPSSGSLSLQHWVGQACRLNLRAVPPSDPSLPLPALFDAAPASSGRNPRPRQAWVKRSPRAGPEAKSWEAAAAAPLSSRPCLPTLVPVCASVPGTGMGVRDLGTQQRQAPRGEGSGATPALPFCLCLHLCPAVALVRVSASDPQVPGSLSVVFLILSAPATHLTRASLSCSPGPSLPLESESVPGLWFLSLFGVQLRALSQISLLISVSDTQVPSSFPHFSLLLTESLPAITSC